MDKTILKAKQALKDTQRASCSSSNKGGTGRGFRPYTFPSAALLAAAVAGCSPVHSPQDRFNFTVAFELPARGDAAAEALEATEAFRAALSRSPERTPAWFPDALKQRRIIGFVSPGSVPSNINANAHLDEGTDASERIATARSDIASWARLPAVSVVLGGIRANLAAAESAAAEASAIPYIALAPLPDGCASASGLPGREARSPSFSISVAGGDSLEIAALAQFAASRGRKRVALLWDSDARAVSLRPCAASAFHRFNVGIALQAPRPATDAGFRVFGAHVRATRNDASAYIGPAERGTLFCEGADLTALRPENTAAAAHRGYDSRTLPPRCAWLRRTFEADPREPLESLAGLAAGRALASTIRSAAGSTEAKNPRDALRRALHSARRETGFAPLEPCADGSASGAWFEFVPRRPQQPRAIFVRDARCRG